MEMFLQLINIVDMIYIYEHHEHKHCDAVVINILFMVSHTCVHFATCHVYFVQETEHIF